jgi:hypothetical protein
MGHAVLLYEDKNMVFDSRRGHWTFSIDLKSFQTHYSPGVNSASNRNEYQESSWAKGRPTRKADFTAVFEPIV